ncbi:hypothetical protein DRH14_00425 [Candidatus Shapirobacteria bacterium]|nr:MAG: hypothetical protein DRH14_00425 [Candidatus Shapirobacteria bacterium]
MVFIVLLFLYFLENSLVFWGKLKLIKKLGSRFDGRFWVRQIKKIIKKVDGRKDGDVSRMYIIELAFRNLKAKKGRAVVTIGGMAVGVGAIVFLVSLGYGLERLVIKRVARLDELRMVDVGVGEAVNVKINDDFLAKVENIKGIEKGIPSVSMVSRINFNNSVLDVMSFGVNKDYLEAMNVQMLAGQDYEDKDVSFNFRDRPGEVSGARQEIVIVDSGDKASQGIRNFNVVEGEKVGVWSECQTDSQFLGYVIRGEGQLVGEEVWGEHYFLGRIDKVARDSQNEKEFSIWMRAKLPLWMSGDDEGLVPVLNDHGQRKWVVGCVMEDNLVIDDNSGSEYGIESLDEYLGEEVVVGEVLGDSDEASVSAQKASGSAVTSVSADIFEAKISTDSSGIEWVELKGLGESEAKEEDKQVSFYGMPVAEAYVSSGMLAVFNLKAKEAIGKKFKVSYVLSDSLVPGLSGRKDSEEVEYVIKGVVDDDGGSYYYFHLADAKRLGVKNYSQLKIVAKKKGEVAGVRKEIETMGLKTSSALDTVEEIEKLFRNLRVLLGFLGTIALAVASLGMFNTMTVSLLERTREVGVMKSMGMLSKEVKELFLAESMIMGMGGGFFGVLLGLFLGKVVSIALSSVSVFKGQGFMNISYMPWFFAFFILAVSFFVGIATGWYPSKRARQISALNALRYE